MWIYAHTTWMLPGYSRLTHEAIQFMQDEITEVTQEVGQHLLGTHPLQFCEVSERSLAEQHSCPNGTHPNYRNTRLGRPTKDRMMRTA